MLMLAVAAGSLLVGGLALWRPRLPTSLPPVAVPLAAAAGAIALAVGDAAPTGWSPFDLLLRASFGAVVPLASARAGTVATGWLVVVVLLVLGVADAPAEVATGLGAGALLSLALSGTATGPARALVAATAIAPLAHADWSLFTGSSSVAAAVAALPVLARGLARSPGPVRRSVGGATAVAAVLVVAGAVLGLLAALSARSEVDDAVSVALDGVDLLGDEDDEAQQRLREAAARFEEAEGTMDAWWALPARLVPVVSQQSRAVSTMASTGADLTRTAADAAGEADLESVRPREGRIDLDAMSDLVEPLDRSLASLEDAAAELDGARSPLLLAPVADRMDDLGAEIDAALASARLAVQAVDVAPEMLGADGPRRYLLAFQNPSEMRGNGGFMGNWAELVADDGSLELTRSGRVRELSGGGPDPDARRIEGETQYVELYGQAAAEAWGLIGFSPDHPTVSRIMAQLYPESGGQPLDGVIALTPSAFEAFLELTGPIEVPGYPRRLTPENAARVLMHEHYLEFPRDRAEDREQFLADAVETLFDELTSGDLPGPAAMARELGPSVEARHLQLWATDPDARALFETIGATGSVRRSGTVASFGAVGQNYGGNKIDWFLRRRISYEASWDPETGAVEGTLSVRLENRAPSSGLPSSIIGWGGDPGTGQIPVEDGENLMLLTLYAAHPFESVTVDGEPVDFGPAEEVGHSTARLYVSVPPGGVREVVARGAGELVPSGRLVVRPLRQVSPVPDELRARVTAPAGWRVDGSAGRTSSMSSTAARDRELVVEVDRVRDGLPSVVDALRGDG